MGWLGPWGRRGAAPPVEPHDTSSSEHGPRVMGRSRAWKRVLYPGEAYGEPCYLRADPGELHSLCAAPGAGDARGALYERALPSCGATRRRR